MAGHSSLVLLRTGNIHFGLQMPTHLCSYYMLLTHSQMVNRQKFSLHVKCVYIYICTQTYTHAVETVSCSDPKLAGGLDEQWEILVKNVRFLAAV